MYAYFIWNFKNIRIYLYVYYIYFILIQGNASGNSSRCSTPTAQQVTKVTATAKFKVEVHTPATGATTTNSSEPPTRPVSASGSRRSSRRNSSNQHGSAPSSGNSSVHSSLSDSLRSSLSSYDGDAGFSDNK